MINFNGLSPEFIDDFKSSRGISQSIQINLSELFTDKFMNLYTNFGSFDEFIKASNFDWSTQEQAQKIPVNELDEFVVANSKFISWSLMFHAAVSEYQDEQPEA
ncbi:MAG: hypothetical protein ACRCZN_09975 [Lactococcus lactis]